LLWGYLSRTPPLPREVDILHAMVEFPYGIVACRMARRRGTPVVLSAQGTYAVAPFGRLPDRWLFQSALRHASLVTAPSAYTRAQLLTNMPSLASSRLRLIHNPVDFERFQTPLPAPTLRRQWQGESRVVLSVGALKRRKGFDLLIRAMPMLPKTCPPVHLVIAGGGNPDELRQLAASLGLSDRVHLVGSVCEQELTAWFQHCDVYAHTPRVIGQNFEGFGLVLLEAASCGKPIVAARSGGVPDAVLPGESALMVAEEDPAGTAQAIARILTEPSLARRLGGRGRAHAHAHRWEWYTEVMVLLYKELQSKAGSRSTDSPSPTAPQHEHR